VAGATDGGQDVAPADAALLGSCFQQHLEEAIALNQARKPRYSSLSGGRSEAVSDALIRSEQTSLILAARVDEAAEPFHAVAVPIVCDEFVPMDGVPGFRERTSFAPEPLDDFEAVDGDALSRELEASFAEGGFPALSQLARAKLDSLSHPRAYHCMTRHMLESVRRIANFAPVQDARARAAGMSGALALSEDMVRLHLLSLGAAARLDERAAPLQAEGLPIICRDVPAIPPGPEPAP